MDKFDQVNSQLAQTVFNNNYNIVKKHDDVSNTYYFLTVIETDATTPIRFDYGKEKNVFPSEYAREHKTTLTINGGLYPSGVSIINKEVISDSFATGKFWSVAITDDNELFSIPPGTPAGEIMGNYPNVVSCLAGFTPLVENGQSVSSEVLADGEKYNYNEVHPRQMIGKDANGNIIFITTGGRGSDGVGMTASDCIRVLQTENAQYGFMLDGGGSVSLVEKGVKRNKHIDNFGTSERAIRTVISLESPQVNNSFYNDIRALHSTYGETYSNILDINNVKVINDLNAIEEPGDYWATPGVKGVPNTSSSWFIIHKQLLNDKMQVAFPFSSASNRLVYVRRTLQGSWTEWGDGLGDTVISGLSQGVKPSELPFGESSSIATDWEPSSADSSIRNGLVKSFRYHSTLHAYTKQVFYHGGSSSVFVRTGLSNDTWSAFRKVDMNTVITYTNFIEPINTVPSGRLAVDYPIGITTTYISGGGDRSDLPVLNSGTLTTIKPNNGAGRSYQEFKEYNNWNKYVRYELTDGAWAAWKKFVLE